MDPSIKALQRAARRKPPIRHSAVYTWLRKRHDELAAVIRDEGPGWELVRSVMAKQGLTNKNGSPLTVSSVRQTWAIVCRHVRDGVGAHENTRAKRKPSNRSPRSGTLDDIRASATPPKEAGGSATPFAPIPATPGGPARWETSAEEAKDTFRRQLENRHRPIRPRSTP